MKHFSLEFQSIDDTNIYIKSSMVVFHSLCNVGIFDESLLMEKKEEEDTIIEKNKFLRHFSH